MRERANVIPFPLVGRFLEEYVQEETNFQVLHEEGLNYLRFLQKIFPRDCHHMLYSQKQACFKVLLPIDFEKLLLKPLAIMPKDEFVRGIIGDTFLRTKIRKLACSSCRFEWCPHNQKVPIWQEMPPFEDETHLFDFDPKFEVIKIHVGKKVDGDELVLAHLARKITSDEVFDFFRKSNQLVLGDRDNLEALREIYIERGWNFPVVALGSVWVDGMGIRNFPVMSRENYPENSEEVLTLWTPSLTYWDESCRFLARKK